VAENAPARVLAALGLGLLFVGMAGVVLAARGSQSDGQAPSAQAPGPAAGPATARPSRPAQPTLRAVALTPVGAFDPEGDGSENDELAAAAADRDPTTSWRTERYSSFFKDGVGLVLDARRPLRFARVVVSTDTPGFVAEIRVGASQAGPFRPVSAGRTVAGRTVFALSRTRARYVLVWITELPDGTAAHITEVRAVARQR
jgi:eukaryotic-like serine/threonine-protein kinase